MTTFARVPVVPGDVLEIYIGDELFPMHPDIAATWYEAPDGTEQWYTYDGTNFSPPAGETLEQAQSAKIQSLNESCSAQINGGFQSSALGEEYNYTSRQDSTHYDQTNLNHAAASAADPTISESWTTPIWYYDSENNWTFGEHTAPQVQQVSQNFLTMKTDARNKLINLTADVYAATTIDEVNAINW